ncbi:filaggrin-2-like [Penaeus japonicus]|uniref:filaggrin-2-like n=1 Tax=Penaeus japonicus TaxID=27405 RepID=UPI001C717934|nr:filaggrin-2-like [Penaeus japonicus]
MGSASGGHDAGTLYVSRAIPSQRVRSEVGRHLAAWCQQRPTWRLSRRRPSLPSYRDYLRTYAANQTANAGGAHVRSKRRAGRRNRPHRSVGGKNKKGRRRGKKGKKAQTKSLRRSKKTAKSKASPRLEFPAAQVLKARPEEDREESVAPTGQVVLQEEPYLSPSFVRTEENGQGFRHYRDFYHNSDADLDAEEVESSPVRHRSKPRKKSRARKRSKIDIPETIVKDGQIFYRYDAELDSGRNRKDQSKRSHQDGREYLEGEGDFLLTSDKHIADTPPDILIDRPLGAGEYGGGAFIDHNLLSDDYPLDLQVSHVQTQAQMGRGNHAASAGAQMDSGPAVQVQGSATSGGFFSAQAHTTGHQGMSQTQVHGNMHGVQGSAMTHGRGRHSQAQVQMGAHSLSAAQVLSHNNSLSSTVQTTPLGGSAESEAHGHGVSTSHAHMDFHPSQQYHGGSNTHHGQGTASASVSSKGTSSLASLTGDISTGSYLGTAQSTMSNNHLHHELTQDGQVQNADGVHGNAIYDVHETHTDPAGVRGDNAVHTGFGQGEAISADFGQGDFGRDIGHGETFHSQFVHGISEGSNQVAFTQDGQAQTDSIQGQYFPYGFTDGGFEDVNATAYDLSAWREGNTAAEQEQHGQYEQEGPVYGPGGHENDLYTEFELENTLQEGDVSKQLEGGRSTYGQEGSDISRQYGQGSNIHGQFEQRSDIHGPLGQRGGVHGALGQGGDIHGALGQRGGVHGALGQGGDIHEPLGQRGGVHGALGQGGDIHEPLGQRGGVHGALGQGGDIHGPLWQRGGAHGALGQGGDIHGALGQGGDIHEQFDQGRDIHRQFGQENLVGSEGSSQHDRNEEGKTGHFDEESTTLDQSEQHSQVHAEFEHENLVHTGIPVESTLQEGQEGALQGGLSQDAEFRNHGQTAGHEDLPFISESLQELQPIDGSYDPSAVGGAPHMRQDMLGSIMETVHQPDMHPAIASYPASEWSYPGQDYQYIDLDGLHGGAGIPPRESEIEQSSVPSDFEEGDGQPSDDRRIDLATYTHGSHDSLSGQGKFHIPKIDPSPYYDYTVYSDYGYEGGDYGDVIPHPDLSVHYDLEDSIDPHLDYIPPEILQPPHLYPSTAETAPLPQPAVSPQRPQQPFLPGQPEPELTTPMPRIVVHQVQMSLPQPDADDLSHTPTQPSVSPQPTTVPTISPQVPTQSPHPHDGFTHPAVAQDSFLQPVTSHTTLVQPLSHVGMPAPQHVDTSGPHMPAPQPRPASQPESHPPTIPPVDLEGTGNDRQMVMRTIPLPGGPGTTLTLPNVPGSPTINVMAMPAPGRRLDGSPLYERPGRPIQPGEKIPGARGYKVPSGFRGHVVLGNNVPVATNRITQGLGAHGHLSPQRASHDSTLYSSAGASQRLAGMDNSQGVHMTFSSGIHSQGPHSASAMSSAMSSGRHGMPGMQRVYSYRQTVTSQNMPMSQSEGTGPTSSGKSWDSMMSSGKSWNSKSWGSDGEMACGYFSMNCNVVFGPFKETKVCKPIHIAKICCC